MGIFHRVLSILPSTTSVRLNGFCDLEWRLVEDAMGGVHASLVEVLSLLPWAFQHCRNVSILNRGRQCQRHEAFDDAVQRPNVEAVGDETYLLFALPPVLLFVVAIGHLHVLVCMAGCQFYRAKHTPPQQRQPPSSQIDIPAHPVLKMRLSLAASSLALSSSPRPSHCLSSSSGDSAKRAIPRLPFRRGWA